MRDIKLRSHLSKNIYLSLAFLEVRALIGKSAYVNACLLSTDSQSPR